MGIYSLVYQFFYNIFKKEKWLKDVCGPNSKTTLSDIWEKNAKYKNGAKLLQKWYKYLILPIAMKNNAETGKWQFILDILTV
jgi:hypothetical protein